MAAINQIKLNSTGTTYDINDKRISTSAVSTVDYILGSSSSSLTTISPISASNLASVLGGLGVDGQTLGTSANNIRNGRFFARNVSASGYNIPSGYGALFSVSVTQGDFTSVYQVFITVERAYYTRVGNGQANGSLEWTAWVTQ